MATIKVCDICGKPIRQHAKHEYRINKRFWELENRWEKIDFCEECYLQIVRQIQSKKEQNDDDCISRQATINAIENTNVEITTEEWDELTKAIKSLPSTEPKTKCIAQIKIDRDDMEDLINEKVSEMVNKMSEPRTGKWIDRSDGGRIRYSWWECCECDQCGETGSGTYNFCPNCGARMEGAE